MPIWNLLTISRMPVLKNKMLLQISVDLMLQSLSSAEIHVVHLLCPFLLASLRSWVCPSILKMTLKRKGGRMFQRNANIWIWRRCCNVRWSKWTSYFMFSYCELNSYLFWLGLNLRLSTRKFLSVSLVQLRVCF